MKILSSIFIFVSVAVIAGLVLYRFWTIIGYVIPWVIHHWLAYLILLAFGFLLAFRSWRKQHAR